MTVQWSTTVRNGVLDEWQTAIGVSAILEVWSGSIPANCAAASTGTKLLHYALASNWASPASAGSKSLSNLPLTTTGLSGAGAGTNAGYYRIFASDGVTCHEQGTITVTGGGGDMTLDNISIANGQTVNVNSFSKSAPGA